VGRFATRPGAGFLSSMIASDLERVAHTAVRGYGDALKSYLSESVPRTSGLICARPAFGSSFWKASLPPTARLAAGPPRRPWP
jgi:hypothetical protein